MDKNVTSEKIEKQRTKVEKLQAQLEKESEKLKQEYRKELERQRKAEDAYLKALGKILDEYLTEKTGSAYQENRTLENAEKLLKDGFAMHISESEPIQGRYAVDTQEVG